MKKNLHFIFLIALLLAPVSGGSTERPSDNGKALPATAYKLIAFKVTGTERYNDKEILAASGLELGQSAGEGDFKEAARRLGDTGMFTDVAYTYSYSGAGTKLELQLTDVEKKKLVPAVFENFVWFTDAELLSELEKRVPLFKQALPVAGVLPDRLSDALQSILSEKQLPGHVDYLRQGSEERGDLTGIAYRVTDVEIHIRNCQFPGASTEQTAALEAVAHKLKGAPYERSALAVVARLDFLPVYLERGYLKADFGPSEAKVVAKSAANESDSDIQVDAILPVKPGKVYATAEVAWKGNAAVKTAELQGLIHLPVGEPADARRLESELKSVAKLYRSRGYMVAQVTPAPTIDEEKATVRYDLTVAEGDQYKMGELEIVGLDTQATTHLQEAWKLREGDPYDAEYARKFLDANNRLLPGGVTWNIAVHEAVNAKDKTVDVTLRFLPK
jgi:outer membrane protein insertion porin family